MGKQIILMLWMVMASFSVVISHAMPHHHHHDESIICLADDLQEAKECCENHPHSAGNNCCNVKNNLITHFGDSRKQELHCDCNSTHHFHGAHLYIVLASLVENFLLIDQFTTEGYEYSPYSNFYNSILSQGHIGLRAPPIASFQKNSLSDFI